MKTCHRVSSATDEPTRSFHKYFSAAISVAAPQSLSVADRCICRSGDTACVGRRDARSPFRSRFARCLHAAPVPPAADHSKHRLWRRPEHRLPVCVRGGASHLDASVPDFHAAALVSSSKDAEGGRNRFQKFWLSKLRSLHACRAGECVVQFAVVISKLRYCRASWQRAGELGVMTRIHVSGSPAALLTAGS